MAIFSWRQTGLGDLTDNAEERLRNEINILEQRVRILEEMVINSARAPEGEKQMSIYDNELPLGILREKDQETYRALRDWHEAGKPVETFSKSGWGSHIGRMYECFAYRAVREPPTAEEVERLRRKVAAGEKLAGLVREHYAPQVGDHYGSMTVMPEQFVAALRKWEAADD